MKRKDFDQLITNGSFRELFVSEMGWNNPSNSQPIYITIDEQDYDFIPVAEKSGFQVYTCTLPSIPVASDCKKIDNKLRNYGYDYICIFIQEGTSHHLWLTPVKTNEKRELVKTEYPDADRATFIWQKVTDLSFDITEVVYISDVKQKIQGSFNVNSEKVTKSFFAQFRKEHKAFSTHIEGLDNDKDRDWYTSVMLNRLMFCYFIQKKGFLDNRTNYLQEKLRWVKEQKGENQFFPTFYKGFLCAMFHEGLNHPRHDTPEFLEKYGRIPYLNGGMFDDHQLEKEHTGIDIKDEAFERLFDFFDKWNWHLDTRLTASGNDINPDVLGYIFEQYINERAAMGAYYTKEDITEYIGKNCIIPFLMDKTATATKDSGEAFKPEGFVWQTLRESGDKYIYDAVKKGYTSDWQNRIPDYIEKGINTNEPNLLERRSRWNEKTHDEFALPTEIWRETVERLQRCDSLLQKISSGEIHQINDFITYNLDIRQFCEDLIRTTTDQHYVKHFYHALQKVTILDPTCGSGAFLFAALNILEPLYEACLDRMEDFHRQNDKLFTRELEEINAKYSSNRQYFIYKSIILRNLYGVDIMVEATEIAKLRLFLKMVAVVEVDKRKDNLGLDPLPDIDFNIKCGNTLVGYATEKELDNALLQGDMFAAMEFKDKIGTMMNVVATAYSCFRSEQLKVYDDNASIKETKDMLKQRLVELNDLLNRHMYKSITGQDKGDGIDLFYEEWKESHQPFHWLAEFYQIIKGNGGFDVVIGNPPYVEYNKKDSKTGKAISDIYRIKGYKTEECGNLYAYVIERSRKILATDSRYGMIVPNSSVTTPRMKKLTEIVREGSWFSFYDFRPSHLFDGVNIRLCIFVAEPKIKTTFSTKYIRWYAENRNILFSNMSYAISTDTDLGVVTKTSSEIEKNIFSKVFSSQQIRSNNATYTLYYHDAILYWLRGTSFEPSYDGYLSSHVKRAQFESKNDLNIGICVFNSTLFYWFWTLLSNSRDFGFDIFYRIRKPLYSDKFAVLSNKLMNDLDANGIIRERNQKQTGIVRYKEFYPVKSKPIIDEMDKALAEEFSFSDEELDFIINYDIKYRMGDELSNEE